MSIIGTIVHGLRSATERAMLPFRSAAARSRLASGGRNLRVFGRTRIAGPGAVHAGNDALIGDRVLLTATKGSIRIGDGCAFNDSVEIESLGSIAIGSGTIMNTHAVARGEHIVIGEKVWVARHTIIEGRDIEIGDRVIFGPYVHVNDSEHAIDPATLEILMGTGESKPIRIGRNAWIGSGAMILGGVSIGDGAIIGARSVVTRDVPAMCVAVGNPARVIRDRRTGERIDD